MRIRVDIINYWNDSRSFVEYRRYGELEIWNACKSSVTPAPKHPVKIGVTVQLNGDAVYFTDSEFEAHQYARHFLVPQLAVDFSEWDEYL